MKYPKSIRTQISKLKSKYAKKNGVIKNFDSFGISKQLKTNRV